MVYCRRHGRARDGRGLLPPHGQHGDPGGGPCGSRPRARDAHTAQQDPARVVAGFGGDTGTVHQGAEAPADAAGQGRSAQKETGFHYIQERDCCHDSRHQSNDVTGQRPTRSVQPIARKTKKEEASVIEREREEAPATQAPPGGPLGQGREGAGPHQQDPVHARAGVPPGRRRRPTHLLPHHRGLRRCGPRDRPVERLGALAAPILPRRAGRREVAGQTPKQRLRQHHEKQHHHQHHYHHRQQQQQQ